jgi:hypothetical protein
MAISSHVGEDDRRFLAAKHYTGGAVLVESS